MSGPTEGREQELAELLSEVRALRELVNQLRAERQPAGFPPEYAVAARVPPAPVLPPGYEVAVRTPQAFPPEYAVAVRTPIPQDVTVLAAQALPPDYAVLVRASPAPPTYEVLVRPVTPQPEDPPGAER
jgi:hypothetical protein